jgi:hypothetical protein
MTKTIELLGQPAVQVFMLLKSSGIWSDSNDFSQDAPVFLKE